MKCDEVMWIVANETDIITNEQRPLKHSPSARSIHSIWISNFFRLRNGEDEARNRISNVPNNYLFFDETLLTSKNRINEYESHSRDVPIDIGYLVSPCWKLKFLSRNPFSSGLSKTFCVGICQIYNRFVLYAPMCAQHVANAHVLFKQTKKYIKKLIEVRDDENWEWRTRKLNKKEKHSISNGSRGRKKIMDATWHWMCEQWMLAGLCGDHSVYHFHYLS